MFDSKTFLMSMYASLFLIAPILSNVILTIFGLKILGGVLVMLVAFGILDVINNQWGIDTARKTLINSLIIRLTVWSGIFLLFQGPVSCAPETQAIVLSSFRILLAGEIANFLSQYFVDVKIFDWLKQKSSLFWIRYNLSNIISQSLGLTLFITIAFLGTGKPLLLLIGSQIIVRIFAQFALTPIFSIINRSITNLKEKHHGRHT